MSTEGRKPLNLLPRSVPATEASNNEGVSKSSSIFGTGKPRDINKPEIKQLEERLEQTLTISKQQLAAEAAVEAERAKLNDSSNSEKNDRLRTDSTTSSNHSNKK